MKIKRIIGLFVAILVTFLIFTPSSSYANTQSGKTLLYKKEVVITNNSGSSIISNNGTLSIDTNKESNIKDKRIKDEVKRQLKESVANTIVENNINNFKANSTRGKIPIGSVTLEHSFWTNDTTSQITHEVKIASISGVFLR